MNMRRALLHPFFFALLPVVTLANANKESIHPRYAIRPAFTMILLIAVAMTLAWLIFRNWHKAAITATTFISLLSAYGHVLASRTLSLASIDRIFLQTALGIIWIGSFLIALRILSRTITDWGMVTQLLNLVGFIGLIIPAFDFAKYELVSRESWPSPIRFPMVESISAEIGRNQDRPDIYYFVLDGYGRADILEQIYAIDNSGFLQALEDQGFFIASRARSNYGQTHLSIASTLNMSYLDFLAESMSHASSDHTPIDFLIGHNKVTTQLKPMGYHVIALNGGYRRTQIREADTQIFEPIRAVTPLESVLIEQSALQFPMDLAPAVGLPRWYPGYQAQRDLVRFELEQLSSIASIPGPKFVFAHIMSPHPPFVFNADGTATPSSFPYSARDGDLYPGSTQSYVSGYRDQLLYLNSILIELLDDIMRLSTVPPVVILQGDHGPGSQLIWDDRLATNLAERMTILNAIYLPVQHAEWKRADLTPVNTFRIVFHEVFGAELVQLEDRSFFSSWRLPYDLFEVEEF